MLNYAHFRASFFSILPLKSARQISTLGGTGGRKGWTMEEGSWEGRRMAGMKER